jgi:hypothetical protein
MTPAEIVARLRTVAAEMESLGAAMDYFGGFGGRMTQHGREMVGAAGIAREWADEIEAEAPPR